MRISSTTLSKSCFNFGIVALVALFAMFFQSTQVQAAPLAGTVIGNQASATYTDASAAGRTATSNTVNTVVLLVPAFTLVASQDKYTTPGGTVYFGHTLTNTGNGSDTINLVVTDLNSGTITFAGGTPKIYVDANGDGLPDNFITVTDSGILAAGGLFRFVVATTVPGAATNGATETIDIYASSADTPTTIQQNTDSITVTNAAVISLTKAESIASGLPGTTPVKYTLTYTNTGNSTATNVTIQDTLDARLTYIAASARWSVTGAGTALTDAAGATQGVAPTIDYYTYSANTKIWAMIDTVGAGQSGTLTFEVTVNSAITPGVIPNSGSVIYNDGGGNTQTTPSNQVDFVVDQYAAVVLDDVGSTNDASAANDDVYTGSATQGGTISFDNVVHNNGNGSDTFNIIIDSYTSTYPAGTSFKLYKADGVSPLVDTNGDNIPDTGPIAGAGSIYHVFMQITLPANASGNNAGAGYTIEKRAVSVFDGTKMNVVSDSLGTITANTVDLTNDIANALGAGAGPEAASVTDKYADPLTSVTFLLNVNNGSGVPDSYDLLADMNPALFPVGMTVNDTYANWSVIFKVDGGAGTCATTGAAVTNTGTINAAANAVFCAIVNVPTAALPGAYPVYFQVKSPTSGAGDQKHDRVYVNTVRSIQITSPNAGQIFPGGSIVYTHIITNEGNVAEGTVAVGAEADPASSIALGLADSLSANGWTSVIYADTDGSGALGITDPVITDLSTIGGLAVADTYTLFVKVFAPLGAAVNAINTTTITATTAGTVSTIAVPIAVANDDNTTVIAGQVRLVKTQAVDVLCDGTADGAYVTANQNAKPGECLRYKVTATNDGTANVTSLIVSDATPANTTYTATVAASVTKNGVLVGTAAAIRSTPADLVAGTITVDVYTLTPAQASTIEFGVKINP